MKLKKAAHYIYSDQSIFNGLPNATQSFVRKKYNLGMHIQEFFEINIILKGSGYHYIENQIISVGEGDTFIIPPNYSHGYISDGEFDVYHLLLSNSFMQNFSKEFQKLPHFSILFRAEPLMRVNREQSFYLKLSKEQLKETEYLRKGMHQNPKTTEEILFSAYNAAAFITFLCTTYNEIRETAEKNPDFGFIKALSMIHNEYHQKITLKMLSEISGLSRSAFIKKFTEICEFPPMKYLVKVRIDAAERLLTSTNTSITQIAEETGFYDTAHFVKTFKEDKEVSPSEYRKICQHKKYNP